MGALQINLNFDETSSIEKGAVFLAALAYPIDESKRKKFAASLIFAAREGHRELRQQAPLSVDLLCSIIDRTEAESVLRRGCGLIARERLIAAKMEWPTVHALMADQLGVTHPFAPSPMSEKMLEAVAVDLRSAERMSGRGRKPKGESADQNDSNVKSRVWKPSLPVLHLALALQVEMNGGYLTPEGDSVDALSFGDILLDNGCPTRLLSYANEMRPYVRCAFNLEEKQQLQFIFTN